MRLNFFLIAALTVAVAVPLACGTAGESIFPGSPDAGEPPDNPPIGFDGGDGVDLRRDPVDAGDGRRSQFLR